MADEKPEESAEAPPKPVRKVKKVLTEGPAPTPPPEKGVEKPPSKPVAKAPVKPAAKTPAKPAAKKPAPKPAAAKRAAAKPPEKKSEAEEPAPKPSVEEEKPEKKEKAPARVKPAKKEPPKKAKKPEKKPEKKGEKEREEEEAAEEEHEARKKPDLTDAIRAALRLRRQIARRRPRFYRQEWYRYKRLGMKWRKPQGGQSKLRRHMGWRINVVSIGYRGPKDTRGLHPSGFGEVLVHTVDELKGVDPKTHAVRIAGSVGGRKRQRIQEEADELGLRILNRREE